MVSMAEQKIINEELRPTKPTPPMDKHFTVDVISQTPCPQQSIWAAAKQDYSEDYIIDSRNEWPDETECGQWIIEHLLKGGRGHWGPLEHVKIQFAAGWFPHSVMQQIRTHRHLSFDVQSGRFTGKRVIDVANGDRDTEEAFYCRPPGDYTDRKGKKYTRTKQDSDEFYRWCVLASLRYRTQIEQGFSEEDARGALPFDIRQHWVVSANLRALCHLLTIRGKGDVQLEARQFCELVLPHFKAWTPEVYSYFEQHQWKRGRLAP